MLPPQKRVPNPNVNPSACNLPLLIYAEREQAIREHFPALRDPEAIIAPPV
jgi:hypothetical protein